MASRLFQNSQLLKQTFVRQSVRRYASESNHAAEHFPEENFGGKIWRNGAIAVVAALVWYRADQHITHSGDEKHPFTRWIEYHMTSADENDVNTQAKLAAAEAAAEYKLFIAESQRAPIYRMRYPEAFERASPRGLSTGYQVDLSDLKVKSD